MTGASSPVGLLVLHGVRVLGGPSLVDVADLYDLPYAVANEVLLDAQAHGQATKFEFFGKTSWSLTEAGKVEEESLLAHELDQTGTRDAVAAAHAAFLPLNERHGRACTDWQIRPTPSDPLAVNDHTDPVLDGRVLEDLSAIAAGLDGVCEQLTQALPRFGIHAPRYRAALDRALAGDPSWVNSPKHPSCQILWIQLHEDLLATLGIPRGTDT